MTRGLLVAVAALAALPATAPAQGDEVRILQIGPAKLGAYSVTVQARSDRDELDVEITRRSRNSRQTHGYVLRGDVSLTGTAPDDAAARLIADMGDGGGTLDYQTVAAPERQPVPRGCDGTPGSLRRGVVRGELLLRLDREGFGSLRIRQARAVYGRPAQFGCVNAPQARGTFLEAEKRVRGVEYSLAAEQIGRRIGIFFTVERRREFHQVVVATRRRGALRRPSGGRPGRLLGIGPFLTGRAIFRKNHLGGNLRARFDFIGAQPFPTTRDVLFGHAD